MSNVIQFPRAWVQPDHWTWHHRYVFDYYRNDRGLSLAEACGNIEDMIHRERIVPGESDKARLLRMAQEEFRGLLEPASQK